MTYDKSKYIKVSRYNGKNISRYRVCWDVKKKVYRSIRMCKYCGTDFWATFDTLDEIFSREAVLYCLTTYHFCTPKCFALNEFSEIGNDKRVRILEELNIQEPLESLDEDTIDKVIYLLLDRNFS